MNSFHASNEAFTLVSQFVIYIAKHAAVENYDNKNDLKHYSENG